MEHKWTINPINPYKSQYIWTMLTGALAHLHPNPLVQPAGGKKSAAPPRRLGDAEHAPFFGTNSLLWPGSIYIYNYIHI